MMTLRTMTIAACLTILVACASNQGKPPLSADTNARIKKIQDDYGNYGVSVRVNDHHIIIGEMQGLIPKETLKSIEDSLHDVIGNDFTNFTISINID